MPKPASPLADAATVFDDVLASYARLAELFLKTPLESVKHLERANATLGDIAACEEKLQQAGQALLAALGEARARQEQLSRDVIAHAPALKDRNQALRDLMDEMGQLAGDVTSLNAIIQERDPTSPSARGKDQADVADVSDKVLALSARAEDLAKRANAAQFEEVSTQAHALFQRLSAIAKKLQKAVGN
jgi:predicted  nucleic acid-binding Zn-ribbon protein